MIILQKYLNKILDFPNTCRLDQSHAIQPGQTSLRNQRRLISSFMILGVIKISNSDLVSLLTSFLNSQPTTGTSPSSGIFCVESERTWVKTPPITTVPPFSTNTSVLTFFVLMLGTP